MRRSMNNVKVLGRLLHLWVAVAVLQTPLSAQLTEEIGRLIEAQGEVTIVTNDGSKINAVTILASSKEKGVPIKVGNKIITDEYSSAVIRTLDDHSHTLQEMTSMQFGNPSKPDDKKLLSRLKKLVSFFMRPSGKEGDYRTDVVNTGWEDIGEPSESEGRDE